MKEINNKIQEMMRSNLLKLNYEELFTKSEEVVIKTLK